MNEQRQNDQHLNNQIAEQQVFGIQFVVLRNGEPITDVLSVWNVSVSLHERHDPDVVWGTQAHVLSQLVRAELDEVDAFADVVPNARPVGLQPPQKTALDVVGVPILKRVNRVLLGMVNRVSEYNRKRGRS